MKVELFKDGERREGEKKGNSRTRTLEFWALFQKKNMKKGYLRNRR